MRREGIYSSMLTNWRKQRGQAERVTLASRDARTAGMDGIDKQPMEVNLPA